MDILEDWAAIRKVNLEVFLSELFFFFLDMRAVFIFLYLLFCFPITTASLFPIKKWGAITDFFFLRQKGHWQGEDKKVGHYLIYLHFQNNFAIVGLWYKQIDHLFGMANVPVDLTTLLCTWLWQIFVRTSANKIQFKRLVGHT